MRSRTCSSSSVSPGIRRGSGCFICSNNIKLHRLQSYSSTDESDGISSSTRGYDFGSGVRGSPLAPGATSPPSGPGHGGGGGIYAYRKRSNSGASSQQRKYKQVEEQDKLKKSRAWANAYELSQDLHDKQLEMLERKYGGQLRARRAARIIQQAYRQYCMNKNFAKLRVESEERRLSRRFAEFGRSKTIWSDMVNNIEADYGLGRYYSQEEMSSSPHYQGAVCFSRTDDSYNQNFSVHKEFTQSNQSSRSVRVMHKSHSLQITNRDRKIQKSLGLDLSTIKETSLTRSGKLPTGPAVLSPDMKTSRNSYTGNGDSSASDSPQDTPVEPHIDLPSVNFENLLESKETDILNDSFHSDSSQEHTATTPQLMSPVSNMPPGNSNQNTPQGSDTSHNMSTGRTYENFHSQYSESNLGMPTHRLNSAGDLESHSHNSHNQFAGNNTSDCVRTSNTVLVVNHGHTYPGALHESHIATSPLVTTSQEIHHNGQTPIPIQGATQAIYTKVPLYDNSEVRLRKQWANNSTENSPSDQQLIKSSSVMTSSHPPPNSNNTSKSGKDKDNISPIWKRKSTSSTDSGGATDHDKRMSNISETSEPDSDAKSVGSLGDRNSLGFDDRGSRDGLSSQGSDTASMGSGHEGGNTYHRLPPSARGGPHDNTATLPRTTDRQRKRAYRIGLNLFNKKPEKGIKYLMERRFIDVHPKAVAKFMITRKGLSKQMIGEYLGNLQRNFNMEVLEHFADEIDLTGLQVDMALRKFQSHFRMPGEAQKIERLMEAYAGRFCQCNPDQVKQFRTLETIFLLAFAIIMLNTDLHNKNIKQERKMKCPDFIRNLRGIDNGDDIDPNLLVGIYDRIRACEFKSGSDHVTQVVKVELMIVGKKLQPLALPHRRLVCYCRLYQVMDPNKREKLGLHQREVFLFNDLLIVTKIFSKKKKDVTYSFRQQFLLNGMQVYLFETPHYKHGVRLTTNVDGKVLITFNARNEHDRSKFVEDLKEAILEMNEMENQRIIEELHKQRAASGHPHTTHTSAGANFSNRHSKDSGVVDIECLKTGSDLAVMNRLSAPECSSMKKNTLSNSLIDLSEASRRGSGGSLDSGMASEGRGSQEDNSATLGATAGNNMHLAPPSGGNYNLSQQQQKQPQKTVVTPSTANYAVLPIKTRPQHVQTKVPARKSSSKSMLQSSNTNSYSEV